MKYGDVKAGLTAEEFERMKGKKVVAGDYYSRIADYDGEDTTILTDYSRANITPFETERGCFTFIREVIEEEPKYRPFKDVNELLDHWQKIYLQEKQVPSYAMPLIWIKHKDSDINRLLITEFYSDGICTSYNEGEVRWEELFRYYTFLDGTPCGVKE